MKPNGWTLACLACWLAAAIPLARAEDTVPAPVDALQSEIRELSDRVTRIEAKRVYKILRPVKDIEFLYDVVIEDKQYVFQRTDLECRRLYSPDDPTKQVIGLRQDFWGKVKPIMETAPPPDSKERAAAPVPGGALPSVCKLEAVEEVLGIEREAGDSLKTRIKRAYEQINYPEWDSDSIRFGVSAGFIPDIDATAISIAMHAYPSYRRNMPGKLDLVRRTSFYVAVGAVSTADQSDEVNGAAYSAGLSVELTRGVNLTYGSVIYKTGPNASDPNRYEHAGVWGVTLASELWQRLLSNAQ